LVGIKVQTSGLQFQHILCDTVKMRPRERKFWKGAGLVSAEMLGSLLLYAGAMAVFFRATRRHWRKYKSWDLQAFDRIRPIQRPVMTGCMQRITHLGNHRFLVPANLSVMSYYLFFRKRTWFSIRIVAISLSSLFLMIFLKNFFKRKRPVSPLLHPVRGKSFPSGHALMSIAFYGMLIYITEHTVQNEWAKSSLVAGLGSLILLIGFSRIYLRVHYTSDVLAGLAIGGGWLFTSLEVIKKLEPVNRKMVG
jgi:undecaprenyl-diphosphatase